MVVGHEAEKVKGFLRELADHLSLPITIVHNSRWAQTENAASVLAAKEYLQEPFLLLMSDHLFDPDLVRKLLSTTLQDGEVALAIDDDPNNPWVDLQDFVGVRIEDGKIKEFGKLIPVWDGIVTGIFCCSPDFFNAIEQTMAQGDSSLDGTFRHLTLQGFAKPVMVGGHFWIDVDDPPSYIKAERALLRRAGKQSASSHETHRK